MEVKDIIAQESRTTHFRALAKSITWRFFASIDTFLLGWVVTGSSKQGGIIALLEVVTKMALYYLHERGWSMVTWGVKKSATAVVAVAEKTAA